MNVALLGTVTVIRWRRRGEQKKNTLREECFEGRLYIIYDKTFHNYKCI